MNFKQIKKIFFITILAAVIFFGGKANADENVGFSEIKDSIYEELEKVEESNTENDKKRIIKDEEDLLLAAQDASRKIEIITNSFNRDIRSLSQALGIKKLLSQVKDEGVLTNTETEKKYYPQDKEKYWQNVYEYFLRFYRQNTEEIDLVRLFYKNGYVVSGVIFGEEDVNDYKGDKSWFKDVMNPSVAKSGEVYISPISIARRTNSAAIRYAVPIDVDGERLGLAVINFKAGAILKVLDNTDNILFLDKAYEDAEGEIITDWVVTLADSRNPGQALNEGMEAASVIAASQLVGDNGFLEFKENGKMQIGAYQKVDIPCKEWYAVAIVHSDELKKGQEQAQSINETLSTDYVGYVYCFFGSIIIIFFVLALLHYFKIIKLERITLFIILAFSLFLISGVFIFSTYQTTKSVKREIMNSTNNALVAVAMSRAKHIETLLNNYQETTLMMATGNIFKDILDESIGYDLMAAQVSRRIKTIIDSNRAISQIRILDKEGIVIFSSRLDVGVDKSFHDIFLKGKKGAYIGDIHISDYTKNKVISIAAPVLLEKRFVGVFVVNFNVEELYAITTNKIGLGESGEVYMINKNGYMISPSRFKKNTFLTQKIDTVNTKYCFEGKNSQGEHRGHEAASSINYRGINTVGAHAYIPQVQWCLLVEADEEKVFVPISKTLSNIWLFTVGVIMLIIIVGVIFNFLLTSSLKREVEAKTKTIKETVRQVNAQLQIEEKISKEKELLLKEQKQGEKRLEEKIEELEKFQKLTVNRELKMIELKEKLSKLKNK